MSRVAVIGTGVIGAGWAALFLAKGHDVQAHDPAPRAEIALRDAVEQAWPALTRLGLSPGASQERLSFASTLREAVDGAEFVQESGPESAIVKQKLLVELDASAGRDVVIASSTSGLRPSQLQEMCVRAPERVLVGHPFNPTHLIPLVEVVPGARSDPDAVARTLTFYERLGKRPIHVRSELPGHVTNRLQAALWQEAYSLVERGVVSVADVDAAIAHGPGLRWALLGPLVNQHLSGGSAGMAHTLAHLGPPAEEWMKDLRPARLSPALVDRLVRGVADELKGIDQGQLIAQRDEMLVSLIEQKRAHVRLP